MEDLACQVGAKPVVYGRCRPFNHSAFWYQKSILFVL